MKAAAFVTATCRDIETQKTLLVVYVPQSPLPTNGHLLLVPEEETTELNWGPDQTLQTLISGGFTAPQEVSYFKTTSAIGNNRGGDGHERSSSKTSNRTDKHGWPRQRQSRCVPVRESLAMEPIIDPRRGDFEDDASSTKRRSLLSLAGSLLVEISLPKLALAWFLMLVLPSLLLGLAPLAVSAWLNTVKWKFYVRTRRDLARTASRGCRRSGLVRRPAAAAYRQK